MTKDNQVSLDLTQQIDDKLSLWLKDSFDLFEMGQVSSSAGLAIISCLFHALCAGLVSYDCTDEQAIALTLAYLKRARASTERVKATGA